MLELPTLQYLKELKENNNKPWFDANRHKFEAAKTDWSKLVKKILDKMVHVDEDVASLTVKDCIFKQHRDVRFSKDKSPYKPHMGASIDRGGKKSGFAGYYFHLEPGGHSMVGGGLWAPESGPLKRVRQEIDYCFDEFKKIITNKKFVANFGDLAKGEYSLSREPRGYEKDNPAIDYLKLKSFIAIRTLTDEELMQPDLVKKAVTAFDALKPLIKFINRSLED